MAFLYGASVQGIQSFIFQTSKLKEIVGASELVEQICTQELQSFCQKNEIPFDQKNVIIQAAGNIKYLFDSEIDCRKVVQGFSMHIANLAPGITISQAVIKYSDDLSEAINALEAKLKAQRNKVSMPIETGFMGLERDRRTGGVAYIERIKRKGGTEYISEATHKKLQKSDSDYSYKKIDSKEEESVELSENLFFKISNTEVKREEVPHDVDKITTSGKNSWLAIIHADGNALGILLQKLGARLKGRKKEDVQSAFTTFSKALDIATKNAAQFAFNKVVNADMDEQRKNLTAKQSHKTLIYPIRPVLLGGDDLTIIIRADLALDFTIEFLKAFEEQTKEQFKFLANDYQVEGFENGITACAGIAYIKESYPFHYGVHLAELLTKKAKKFSKQDKFKDSSNECGIHIPPSSLAFYKVQSSFIESLEDMTEKTLFAERSNVSFDYGPYFIEKKDGQPDVEMLKEKLKILENESKKDKSKGVSKLRQWISELYKDEATAGFMLDRMKSVNSDFYKELKLEAERNKPKTIIYDVIQLHSLKY
ncbi:MAG: Cas10/Cmr2 second palm domain-containing protein [Spirosomataceae bacterium]